MGYVSFFNWSFRRARKCSCHILLPPAPAFKAHGGNITFTFSHLADAFIQSDLHMCDLQCIHILLFSLMAHCTSGAIRGSALLKDTSTGNRTSNLLITKRLLHPLYHCRPRQIAPGVLESNPCGRNRKIPG